MLHRPFFSFVSFFLFLSFVMPAIVIGQSLFEVKGVLQDSVGKTPLPFATVILFAASDTTNTPIQGTFADDAGLFEIKDLPKGAYRLEAAMLGFAPFKRIFSLTQNENLGTILLHPQDNQTEAIVITAIKPVIEMKEDKLIFNVENDITSKGLNALEVLKKVPMLSVDQNDKIRLKGQSNYKVQLNGKSTGMVAKNPSEALKGFSADAIKKIEVITNPSAKYDAEGTGGIINIITKKQISGTSGSLYLGANTIRTRNLGGQINMKQGKFGLSSYLGWNQWGSYYSGDNRLQSLVPDEQYQQISISNGDYKGSGAYGNVELAYDIDTLTSVSLYSNLNYWDNVSKSQTDFSKIEENGLTSVKNQYINLEDSRATSVDLGADFIKKFGTVESEHELTYSFLVEWGKGKDSASAQNDNYPDRDQRYYIPEQESNRNYTTSLDYVLPFAKKHKFNTGAKFISRNMASEGQRMQQDSISQQYNVDISQSQWLVYKQKVMAAYVEYVWSIEKLTIKPGLRLERTLNDIQVSSLSYNGTKIDSHYPHNFNNLIPTFSATYKPKPSHTLTLSYSKRIQRPNIWYINPFVNTANPQLYSSGNPYLLPELSHSFSLNYNTFGKIGSLNVSLSHNIKRQVIDSYSEWNAEKGIMYSTNYNLGKGNSTGVYVNYSGNFFKNKLEVYLNSGQDYTILASSFKEISYKNQGLSSNFYGSIGYSLPKDFIVGVNGYLWRGGITLQGNSGAYYDYGLSCSKHFLDKKWRLNLGVKNPISKYIISRSESADPRFTGQTYNQTLGRSLRVSISYNFGKLKESVSRKKGISNDDVKAGGGGKGDK